MTHLILLVRVPPLFETCLMPAAPLTSGGIFIHLHLVSLGPGGTALLPLVLIFAVFSTCGCLVFSLLTSFCVLSLTIVVFSHLSVPDIVPLVRVSASSIPPLLRNRHMSKLVSDFWSTWRNSIQRFSSLAKWWDEGKSEIKGLTIITVAVYT